VITNNRTMVWLMAEGKEEGRRMRGRRGGRGGEERRKRRRGEREDFNQRNLRGTLDSLSRRRCVYPLLSVAVGYYRLAVARRRRGLALEIGRSRRPRGSRRQLLMSRCKPFEFSLPLPADRGGQEGEVERLNQPGSVLT